MIISSLIRALLEENSVTMSGFGTFSIVKMSSHIKEDVIYPPKNIIEFEYSKEIEGFGFVSKLSQWKQIRIDEAQTEIQNWINLIEKGLEHNKSLFFDHFGTFSKALSGKIVFQSVIILELNIENEGLAPVYLSSKIKNEEIPNKAKPIKDKRIVLIKKERKRDRLWFSVVIAAASVLLCVLFIKANYYDIYDALFAKTEIKEIIEYVETEATAFISSIKDKPEQSAPAHNKEKEHIQKGLSDENLPNLTANKDQTKISSSELSTTEGYYIPFRQGQYYVIAGSFIKEDDALRHIKEKKLEKYKAKMVVQPQNPRLRVCIGVFDNERDAEKFAAQIDKNYWILK